MLKIPYIFQELKKGVIKKIEKVAMYKKELMKELKVKLKK